jgi:hypothetical protein
VTTTEQLLSQIITELKGIRAALSIGVPGKPVDGGTKSAGGAVASDRELDSDFGNPAVRKDPKRWNADVNGSYAGCSFSECPPDYLDCLADLFDWMGDQDDKSGKLYKDKPASIYKRKDAARARGWSQRKRNGWQAPAPAQRAADVNQDDSAGSPVDDELPF